MSGNLNMGNNNINNIKGLKFDERDACPGVYPCFFYHDTDDRPKYEDKAGAPHDLGHGLYAPLGEVGDKYIDRGDATGYDFTHPDFTQDNAWHELDLSSIIPEEAKGQLIHISALYKHETVTGGWIEIRENGNVNAYNVRTMQILVTNITHYDPDVWVMCDSDGKIEYKTSGVNALTSIQLTIVGWRIPATGGGGGGGAKFKTVTWTGDGNVKSITGVGFLANAITVWDAGFGGFFVFSTADSNAAGKDYKSGAPMGADITSYDADGFTVNAAFNANGATYYAELWMEG